jgi:hypothetical protein
MHELSSDRVAEHGMSGTALGFGDGKRQIPGHQTPQILAAGFLDVG